MRKVIFCYPTDLDRHYLDTSICFISIFEETSRHYSLNLVDCKAELPVFDPNEPVLVYNKKLFDRFFKTESYDLSTEYWLKTGQDLISKEADQILSIFNRFYRSLENNGSYIPFSKYVEISSLLYEKYCEIENEIKIEESSNFYKTVVYPAITGVEKNGLQIDINKFNKAFSKEYTRDQVFCNYYLHTTTGRPSNAFDNINYSALNKRDKSRESFISRFKDGRLIEFDFDAYHVRLIADIIGYNFPDSINLHEYFGKQYFKTDSLTDEQYKESKALTFKFLYSSVSDEFSHIEFFTEVERFKNNLWETAFKQGYVASPISKKRVYLKNYNDMSRAKLFNYLLQSVETEVSMIFINEVLKILKEKKSKLVLYTYDSFLIDFNPLDGKTLLTDLVTLIKHAKVKVGRNYDDLVTLAL